MVSDQPAPNEYNFVGIYPGPSTTATTAGPTVYQQENYNQVVNNHNRKLIKPYICNVCDIRFQLQKSLVNHQKSKHAVFIFTDVCHICDKGFHDFTSLANHLKLKHSIHYKITCTICFKVYKSKKVLKQHMKLNTVEKPFKCEECPIAFRQSNHLKTHKLRHSRNRIFFCNFCDRRFRLEEAQKKSWKVFSPTATQISTPWWYWENKIN